MWHYLRALGAPPSMWAAIYSIAALVFTVAVLLFRALLLRGAWWSALLVFLATWVTCEYVRNLTTPHGTAGSFAYSQLNFLPFLQLASITGPWGMSFLLMLFPAALAVGSGTWGVAICKDMDFTPLSRHYGEAGAGLLLVPAWDVGMDRWWHGHIAVMRGVENGFNIARAAKDGYLTVSDDRGRILAETRSDSSPFATLVTEVPVMHHTTLYLLIGDWFSWFALATLVFTLIQLYRLRRYPPNDRLAGYETGTMPLFRSHRHSQGRFP